MRHYDGINCQACSHTIVHSVISTRDQGKQIFQPSNACFGWRCLYLCTMTFQNSIKVAHEFMGSSLVLADVGSWKEGGGRGVAMSQQPPDENKDGSPPNGAPPPSGTSEHSKMGDSSPSESPSSTPLGSHGPMGMHPPPQSAMRMRPPHGMGPMMPPHYRGMAPPYVSIPLCFHSPSPLLYLGILALTAFSSAADVWSRKWLPSTLWSSVPARHARALPPRSTPVRGAALPQWSPTPTSLCA